MPLNPQLVALLASAAASGDVSPLAAILAQDGAVPPTSIAAAPAAFPTPPRGGGIPQGAGAGGAGIAGLAGGAGAGLAGLAGGGALPAISQAAPQALGNAAPQAPISPTSSGGILPGGSPGGPAPSGVNPLEALVPPTPGQEQQQPAPRAIRPGPGGQINPQIMALILQALGAGGQQQQPAQSLGSILGQLR